MREDAEGKGRVGMGICAIRVRAGADTCASQTFETERRLDLSWRGDYQDTAVPYWAVAGLAAHAPVVEERSAEYRELAGVILYCR